MKQEEVETKKGLHQIFQARAIETPSAIAVSCGEENLTYAQLDKASDYYGNALRERGIGNNDLVGMCLERNINMIVSVLSILKAGAAYVPIDPAYPQDRRHYIADDSELKVILTEKDTTHLFNADKYEFIEIDREKNEEEIGQSPVCDSHEFDLAYVIYTSGTTGNPKGVLVDHGNVIRLFDQTRDVFNFTNQDVWTLFHSICFDFSVWEVWGALLYGAELVVVPYNVTRAADRFYALLESKEVTVLSQTPSAFRNLVDVDSRKTGASRLKLRCVVFGGEKLEAGMLQNWVARNGYSTDLVNMYGITETTVHVTYVKITQEHLHQNACPIGVAIPDLSIYLLDENGNFINQGETGEMWIAGPGVTRGYLNREELTTERFPTREINGQQVRMYKSGDLAEIREDGLLYYKGRADDQIKLNGFRIEPGELEAISNEFEAVIKSLVLKVDFAEGDSRLINFALVNTTLLNGHAVELSNNLHEAFKARVPSHMRPFQHVLLNRFPQTLNGKVDKKALIQKVLDEQNGIELNEAGGQEILEVSSRIWKTALSKEYIDPRMDLFDLGGTSLSLIQIMNLTQQSFNVQLDMGRFTSGLTFDFYVAEIVRLRAEHIWKRILNIENTDPEADFFDLGGTSLSLIQLMHQTKELLNIQLEMSNFSDGLTWKAYANEVSKGKLSYVTTF